MRTAFTLTELTTLRRELAKIETVNPERLSQFHEIFDGCNDDALLQLASSHIKFVSKLAVNACARRGIKVAA